MQLFDSLAPEQRSKPLRDSLSRLAQQDVTERGAIFTRPEVVDAILDLVGYTPDRPLHKLRLLEPAFGGGAFLMAVVERLLGAFERAGGRPTEAAALSEAIVAVEIHPVSYEDVSARIGARLTRWGCAPDVAQRLIKRWLVQDDFLLASLPERFDFVVGNPPYVRQERIEGPLLAEYRRRYSTLYDRADLYIPFFERGLRSLGPRGRLGYICSNRWIKNRYGGPLRALVAREFHLSHYIDMEGADVFQSAVITYPAITIIERDMGQTTRAARTPEFSPDALASLVGAMLNGGPKSDRRIHEIARAAQGEEPWLLDRPEQLRVLRSLENGFPTLEEAGCRIGIGVATGADRVYIGDYEQLPVERERKLPLLMASDLVDHQIAWKGRGVVNPYEPDGSLADFQKYPLFARYLESHKQQLVLRHCAAKTPKGWYKTIDRISPTLTQTPKLLIPDIKGEPTVIYDEGSYYPHHNLYWIGASTWDLRALATLLRSSVMVLFASAYSVKMAGGFMRFQAQVLRRVRVPTWDSVPPDQREALLQAAPTDQEAVDAIAAKVYGLSSADAALLHQLSADARVRKRLP